MESITSRNNKTVTEVSKLKDKKYRDRTGLYYFEGAKLFGEAILSGADLQSVFVLEGRYTEYKKLLDRTDAAIYTVSESVYEKLTDDKAPDGIFAVAKKRGNACDITGKCFILSEVRDPGNIGTCIRSARAFGIDTLILHSCADIYSPKVIRSTMGAFFRQNMITADDIFPVLEKLLGKGYSVLPTALSENSRSLGDITVGKESVFIVGNEGHGISRDILDAVNNSVIIPMKGDTESLNASVAASLLMWEMSKV